MNYKWIGALLIISGCGLFGFSISATYRKEERELRQLVAALDYMACELEYRATPLPDLFRQVSHDHSGFIGKLFSNLALELESQVSPDVQSCVAIAAVTSGPITPRLEEVIYIMGSCFGRFDLAGQLHGIEHVKEYCCTQLNALSQGRDFRLRSYQTLGLCAGAALAILLV